MIKILGILNLTPDSFYAPSRTPASEVVTSASEMLEKGAWGIDLGAVSTRPGHTPVSEEEEWRRLSPSLELLRRELPGTHFSVDTFRSSIVQKVYDILGPFTVNDITAGALDPEMLPLVGKLGLPYIAMHIHGSPSAPEPTAGPIVDDVVHYFTEFEAKAVDAGIKEWILDPGFGFSKTLEQNYQLLEGLRELKAAFEQPILVGLSRKSMVYKALGISPEEAMPATQVLQFAALERGASWLRVHDVAAAVQTARLYSTIYTSSPGAAK
ncbi:MAG: dihydropteroate synthase [Bacteroidales bacterium]|nr:dihydropteroate synthase [Bacteroidales bacterium]